MAIFIGILVTLGCAINCHYHLYYHNRQTPHSPQQFIIATCKKREGGNAEVRKACEDELQQVLFGEGYLERVQGSSVQFEENILHYSQD